MFDFVLEILRILFIPVLSAIIGYSTNYLAIKMLFRPYSEKRFFGKILPFTPGLIPKGKSRLAKSVARVSAQHVLTAEAIRRQIGPLENFNLENIFSGLGLPHPKEFIINIARDANMGTAKNFIISSAPAIIARLKEKDALIKLDESAPKFIEKVLENRFGRLAAIFLDGEKIYSSIKEEVFRLLDSEENINKFCNEIENYLENKRLDDALIEKSADAVLKFANEILKRLLSADLLEVATERLIASLNVEEIIEREINKFNPEEIETLVFSVVRKEMRYVIALGGVLGFIIGWLPAIMNVIR